MISNQTPLNPKSQEYKPQIPTPPPPMPLIFSFAPSPLPLVVPPSHTTALQLDLQPYLYSIITHYTHFPLPVYTPVPANLHTPPPVCNDITDASSSSFNPEQRTVESPRRDVVGKGGRQHRPPRLCKTGHPRTQPQPPKQEWRLKNSRETIAGCKTTLMIKNIPNQLRRDYMLKFLDRHSKSHSVAYDFFYLPIDFENPANGNFGYAFVNFTTTVAANLMKKVLNKYKWDKEKGEVFGSKKVIEMRWARIQGKEALMRRYQPSKFKCSNEGFLPVILDPPRNGSDPNPPPPLILGNLISLSL